MTESAASNQLRVALEIGPRGKKVVAYARDWPGLERGAKTSDAALTSLLDYVPRYAKVAKIARLGSEFPANPKVRIAEEYVGNGSTDFWGISFAFSKHDTKKMSAEEVMRELALMKASWKFFDSVHARVSSEMQKGARGGGRDRDHIVRHVLGVEQDWATKLAVRSSKDPLVTDTADIKLYRDAYAKAISKFNAEGKKARTWPLRYLIRHTAFHSLDHAWEMEDKDLTNLGA